MTGLQIFAVLAFIGVIALLAVCVVFLAVTAYALSIAVIARPDVDESMKTLPRKYVRFSSRVMEAPSSLFIAFVKVAIAALVFGALIFWANLIG
jgi:hypothetical protein